MKSLLTLTFLAAALAQASTIRLRTMTLDTSAPQPRPHAAAAQRPTARGTAMYLVQFPGPVLPQWKDQLAATGCRAHDYVPDYAFVVEATPDQIDAARALACVRWTGEFRPEYKIVVPASPTGLSSLTAHAAIAPGELIVTLFAPDDAADVQREIAALGGMVLRTGDGVLRVRCAPAAAASLATLAAVAAVLPALQPHTVNDIATGPGKLNVTPVWTNGTGLTGRGQIVGHADTGLDNGTNNASMLPDFTNRIKAAFALGRPNDWSDRDTYSHGTHTAGSILGNGSMSGGQFKGVAYAAQLVHQSTEDSQGNLSGIPENLKTLYQPAYNEGARFHSDSWGADDEFINGTYYTWCRDTDEFVWQNPDMTILFAAGNGAYDRKLCGVIGNDFIILPGTSKNIISVGAAENLRTPGTGGATSREYMQTAEAAYRMPPIRHDKYSSPWRPPFEGVVAWSARGPCDDGRIKPDLVAPGSDVVSCRSTMTNFSYWKNLYPGNSNYLFMSGTSMATPLAAGCAAIVRQYLQERRGIANPSAALIKAVLCAGARSLYPGQYGTGRFLEIPKTRPNNVEGWGMIDMANTVTPPAQHTNIFFDRVTLATGARNSYAVVLAGQHQLCVMLVWSDYKGSTTAAQALVNDLDLIVITPDGATNYPNALAGADHTNNVEGVLLPGAPQAGVHRIEVSGYNVPQGPQPYALVMRENTYHPPVVVTPTTIELFAAIGASASTAVTLSNNAIDQTAYDIETLPTWYTVTDSTMPGGPAYQWIDIAPMGITCVWYSSNATKMLTNGFNFPLCGRSYPLFKVSSYGAMSVTNMTIGYEPAPYPNRYGAIPKIAPLQDYLMNVSGVARFLYHTNAERLIVSWIGVENGEEGGAAMTFQTILYSNGVMKFQYKTVNSSGTRKASIGFQGHILSNDPYWCEAANYFPRPVNNLAVQFDPPPQRWLTSSADYGLLPPGAVSNVTTITANAAGLTAGVYRASVSVYHSGRNASAVIPVTFTVVNSALSLTGSRATEANAAGDGDGFIEPGETGLLSVTLFNGTAATLSNVTATLASAGPFATPLVATNVFAVIAPSSLVSNDAPFVFAVAPTATNGLVLPFVLVCTNADGTLLSNTLTVGTVVRSDIAGSVRDLADAAPLTNATVYWQDTTVHAAAAGATGAFRITGLAPRAYNVWADAPGYTASDPINITCPPDVVALALALGKPLPLCAPSALAVEMGAPGVSTAPLAISNAGFGKLWYSLARSNSVVGGFTWLKLAHSNGMVQPFAGTATVVTFDAVWLDQGTYQGAITLHAEAPPVGVPVTLTVLPEPAMVLAAMLIVLSMQCKRQKLMTANDNIC